MSSTAVPSGGITASFIDNSSVSSGSILSGSIGRFHVASGAITSGAIASGSVSHFHMSSGSITSGVLAVTGTPTGTNFLRDDFSWASTAGLQVATFQFTHSTGTASTGAIGFTPKFCLYYGSINITGTGQIAISHGFATGTGGRGTGFSFNEGPGSPQLPGMTAAAVSGQIGGEATPIQNTASTATSFNIGLSVTAFSSAGIDLTWSSSVSSHNGFLLVVG